MSFMKNASRAKKATAEMRGKMMGKTVGVVDRAARVLECFSRRTPELSLPQVAGQLKLPKATTFRILANLVNQGLLDVNPATNVYTLGLSTLRFADDLLGSIGIRTSARPVMQAIRDAVNETVVLSIRDGDHRYNVDSIESTHAIGQTQQIGVPIPLYAGAASRALLANLPDDEIDAYLSRIKLVKFSAITLTDPERLRTDIAEIRKRGYATSAGEFTVWGHAVARAIRTTDGKTAGALHVSIPGGRHSRELEKRCVAALAEGVEALARSRRGA
jgi:DNA-binding IclR family transcriptional regulator